MRTRVYAEVLNCHTMWVVYIYQTLSWQPLWTSMGPCHILKQTNPGCVWCHSKCTLRFITRLVVSHDYLAACLIRWTCWSGKLWRTASSDACVASQRKASTLQQAVAAASTSGMSSAFAASLLQACCKSGLADSTFHECFSSNCDESFSIRSSVY